MIDWSDTLENIWDWCSPTGGVGLANTLRFFANLSPAPLGIIERTFMSRAFIQIMASALTFEASFFLLKGNLGLSVKSIVEIVSARPEHNISAIRSLAMQNADTWVGLLLLLTAFCFQMWANLRPHYINKKGDRLLFRVVKRGQVLIYHFL